MLSLFLGECDGAGGSDELLLRDRPGDLALGLVRIHLINQSQLVRFSSRPSFVKKKKNYLIFSFRSSVD